MDAQKTRFEFIDPRDGANGVAYSAETKAEIIEKAEYVGGTRFHEVKPDNSVTAHVKVDGEWREASQLENANKAAATAEALSKQIQNAAQQNNDPAKMPAEVRQAFDEMGVDPVQDAERRASIGIEARSIAYSNAVSAVKADKLQAIPDGDITAKLAEMRQPETVLASDVSRQWAELDAREFAKLQTPERQEDAATAIAQNMRANPEYGAALQTAAPDIAQTVKAYEAEDDRRVSLKETGKAMDWQVMAAAAGRDADVFEVPQRDYTADRAESATPKTPAEALQSIHDRALDLQSEGLDIEDLTPDVAARLAREDQADFARLGPVERAEAANVIGDNFRNRGYSGEFARNDPEGAQDVVREVSRQGADAEQQAGMSDATLESHIAAQASKDLSPDMVAQLNAKDMAATVAKEMNGTLSDWEPSQSKNWQYANLTIGEETLRIGASTGSVVSVDGRSHSPDGSPNTDIESVRAAMDYGHTAALHLSGNAEKSADTQIGVPMASMPNAVMVYNDTPGMAGAEILNSDGTRISFGGKEAIETFAEENKLSAEDKTKLLELDAQADKYRAGPDVGSAWDAAAMARMEDARRKEFADVREAMGLNAIEPDIERERQQLQGDAEAQRQAWLSKNQPAAAPAQEPGGNGVESDEIFTATQADTKPVVPPEIEQQYLRVGDKFYHPKNTDLVAFEDKGNKLETKSNSEAIAESMVRIAEARGWDEIKVTGSETFRKEVWLEAASRGMHVKGYSPSEQDKAELAKRVSASESNKIEKDNKPFRARENEAEAAPADSKNKRMAETFANASPAAAVKEYPELAGAATAAAAIGKKAEADGLTPAQRAVVDARVKHNIVNSIERGEIPEVKVKEEIQLQRETEREYAR